MIIAYFANDKMLESVDDCIRLARIIAVPSLPGDADQWKARWSPIVHEQEKRKADPLFDDPVVKSAMLTLAQMANSSVGLGHPRYKAIADDILRILRYKNHHFDPKKLRLWVIQKIHWKSNDAQDL